jgi:hypothetical protein
LSSLEYTTCACVCILFLLGSIRNVYKWGNSAPDHTFLIWLTTYLAPYVYFVSNILCLARFLIFLKNFILVSLILQIHIVSFKRMIFFHIQHQNCHYCIKFQVFLSSNSYFDVIFTNTQLKVVCTSLQI